MLWSVGKKTILVRGNEMVRDTEVGEKGVDMFSRSLLTRQRRGDGSIVGWGAGCRGGLGMGIMKEDFHSRGTRPVEMERLNI